MKSIVSRSFLKQKARQIKKEKSLSQIQALNEAAVGFGFTNYKNYLNSIVANQKNTKIDSENLFEKLAAISDSTKKSDYAFSIVKNSQLSFKEHVELLEVLDESQGLVQSFASRIEFLKVEIEKHFIDDFTVGEGVNSIDDIFQYFVFKDISIRDLEYELNGNGLRIDGVYDLNVKFDFETITLVDENDREDERFNDRKIEGSFGLTIDMDKKITIEYDDVSYDY